MSIETKLLGSSFRSSSQGTQVVQRYRAQETGGTLLSAFGDAGDSLALIRVVNDALDNVAGSSGPPIPTQGSSKDFDQISGGGTPITLDCVEVIGRLESCDRATFQCRFSNFPYWNAINNPTNPDPRVVTVRPSGLIDRDGPDAVFAPMFVKSSLEPEGGGASVDVWVRESPVPLRIRREFLTVRCYLADGISDAAYGTINNQIGDLHTFSGTDWEFMGAEVREAAGGLVAGDPVYLYYSWRTERSNGPLFGDDDKVFSLPSRGAFERYVFLGYDADDNPIIESRIPEDLDYLNPNPNGYELFPEPKPIL